MVDKQVRGKYTLEYKLEAVRQVKAGQSVAVVAKVMAFPASPGSLAETVTTPAATLALTPGTFTLIALASERAVAAFEVPTVKSVVWVKTTPLIVKVSAPSKRL